MTRIRASRSTGVVAYALITALMLPSMTAALAQPLSTGAPAPGPITSQATLSMLVFPLRDETGVGEDLGRIATQELARALEQTGGFDAQVFAMNSPSATRHVEEGVLRTEDITPPYEPSSAVTVGYALGVEIVLVGSIIERKLDRDKNVVSLTISVTTYEVAANVDAETGTTKAELKPYRPLFAATGTSVERKIPHRGPITDLDTEAAAAAAKKAAAHVSGEAPAPTKPKKRKFLDRWGAAALIVLAVAGFALAAGGGDERPAADATPPPTNLATTLQTGGVRLSWSPPANPPRSIMRYHVQRRLNNGPQHDISGGLLEPWQLWVIDFDVSAGDRLEYFIRVEYQGNVNSPYVSFGTLIYNPV